MKTLTLCADDAGLDPAVNEAILALAQAGRLQATSVLVDAPYATAFAQAVKPPGLAIGLHLNFTEAAPGAKTYGLKNLIARAYMRVLDTQEIAASIAHQLDRFESLFGRAPDFIDGHQHVHQLPVIRTALLNSMRRYENQSPKRWLRSTVPPRFLDAKAAIIERLGGRWLAREASQRGWPMNSAFAGVTDFAATESAALAQFCKWIDALPSGGLIMCHPATRALEQDAIAQARSIDWQVLSSDAFGVMAAQVKWVARPVA